MKNYRSFFDEIESITVEDELAKFLGVNEDGVIEFTYVDIVKSAGHSCGTVTGATESYGFGGIPTGKFNRRDLLFFEADIDTAVRLTRLDTGKSVGINYTPQKIVNPMAILMSAISPDATEEDKRTFPDRFQEMVQTVLTNSDKVIEIKQ